MIGALWILLATMVVGLILYLFHRLGGKSAEDTPVITRPEGCCGQHEVCEKESLLVGVSDKIEYYEDEELDAYKGRKPDGYREDEIEQFRDILYTLKPDEIAGWARSIQMREIELPAPVHDELIMLEGEARASMNKK